MRAVVLEVLLYAAPLGIWWTFTGLMNGVSWFRTPEEWATFALQRPRLAAFVKLIRATGVNPVFALDAIRQWLAGRTPTGVPPWSSHAPLPPLIKPTPTLPSVSWATDARLTDETKKEGEP